MGNKIDEILKNYPKAHRDDLISILQDIQSAEGYISEEAAIKTGKYLGIATSKIFGLSTFYDQFRHKASAKHTISICHGISCHLSGSDKIIEEAERILKLKPGETSKNGEFTLEITTCTGACCQSPVVIHNGTPMVNFDKKQFFALTESLRKK